MKNLLAFILLFWSAATFGQNQPIIQRSSQTVVAEDARLWARLNFRVPVVVDTFHELNNSYDSLGLEIYVPGQGYYGRDSVNGIHYWQKLSSGSYSIPNLQQVTDIGNITTDSIKTPSVNLYSIPIPSSTKWNVSDYFGIFKVQGSDGEYISAGAGQGLFYSNQNNITATLYPDISSFSITSMKYGGTSYYVGNNIHSGTTPNPYIPISVSQNGTTYYADTTGNIPLPSSLLYPNTANQYLNGYGNFVTSKFDSLTGTVVSGVWHGTSIDTAYSNAVSNINVTNGILKTAQGKGYLLQVDSSKYQNKLTLTTTGSSGAATLSNDILNIPQYSGTSGTITGVTAGINLTGGGTSGTVTLNSDTTYGKTKSSTQGYVQRNDTLTNTQFSTVTATTDFLTIDTTTGKVNRFPLPPCPITVDSVAYGGTGDSINVTTSAGYNYKVFTGSGASAGVTNVSGNAPLSFSNATTTPVGSIDTTTRTHGLATINKASSDSSTIMTAVNAKLTASNNLSDVSNTTTAFNNLAPSQTSNSGKYLTTNGTNTSWATVSGGSDSAIWKNNGTYTGTHSLTMGGNTQNFNGGTVYQDTLSVKVTAIDSSQSIVYNGTSITAQYYTTNNNQGFPTLVSNSLHCTQINHGAVGATAASFISGGGLTGYTYVPLYSSSYKYIFFEYGTNEVVQSTAVGTYISNLVTIVDTAIARNWPPNKIILLPNFYIDTIANPSLTTVIQNKYDTACQNTASRLGVTFINAFLVGINNTNIPNYFNFPVDINHYHPSNQGHSQVAQYIIANLNQPVVKQTGDVTSINGTLKTLNVLPMFNDTIGRLIQPVGTDDSIKGLIKLPYDYFVKSTPTLATPQNVTINTAFDIQTNGGMFINKSPVRLTWNKGSYGSFSYDSTYGNGIEEFYGQLNNGTASDFCITNGRLIMGTYTIPTASSNASVKCYLNGGGYQGNFMTFTAAPSTLVGTANGSIGYNGGVEIYGVTSGGAFQPIYLYNRILVGALSDYGLGAAEITSTSKPQFLGAYDATHYIQIKTTSRGVTSFNVNSNTNQLIADTSGDVLIGTATTNSTLTDSGSVSFNIISTATGRTLTSNDITIICTATGQTFTLPTAVGIRGREYIIKLSASGSCTVATTSSQTIDGSTTYSLSAQYKYVHVQSDNANWQIIGNN